MHSSRPQKIISVLKIKKLVSCSLLRPKNPMLIEETQREKINLYTLFYIKIF
jgi:hypothetical protein